MCPIPCLDKGKCLRGHFLQLLLLVHALKKGLRKRASKILILVPSFLFFGPGQTLEKMENIKWVLYFFFHARARWSPIFSELLSRIECGQSKCACVCVRAGEKEIFVDCVSKRQTSGDLCWAAQETPTFLRY